MNQILLLKNATVPSDPYEEIFQQHNFNPIFLPLLNHEHFNRNDTIAFLTSEEFLHGIPIFIITSQRAVEMFDDCLSQISDEAILDQIFNKIAYTVGPATYEVLEKLGFKDIRGGLKAGNGSKLSELIMNEISPDQRIVFFTGVIRKDIIPKALLKHNYNLIEKVIYKTESRSDIIQNFNEIWVSIQEFIKNPKNTQWIMFFSPQGTESIVEHLRGIELPTNFKIGSIGPTTEEYLQNNNLKSHIVAEKPHAKSLILDILKYIDTTSN